MSTIKPTSGRKMPVMRVRAMIACAIASAVGISIAGINSLRNSLDQQTAGHQKIAIEAVLNEKRQQIHQSLISAVVADRVWRALTIEQSPQMLAEALSARLDRPTINGPVFIVDQTGKVLIGQQPRPTGLLDRIPGLDPALEKAWHAHRDLIERSGEQAYLAIPSRLQTIQDAAAASARFISDGESLHLIMSAPTLSRSLPLQSGDAKRFTAVARHVFSKEQLAEISAKTTVRDLRVQPGIALDTMAAFNLLDHNGNIVAHLIWDHAAISRSVLTDFGTMLPASAALIALILLLVLLTRAFVDHRRLIESNMLQQGHHPVTKLPERPLLVSRIERELCRSDRTDEIFSLLMLSLNTHQRSIPTDQQDKIAASATALIAPQLQAELRAHDLLAHIEDDRLVVLQTATKTPREALALAQRLLILFREMRDKDASLKGFDLHIGISLLRGPGKTATQLLEEAGQALERIKPETHDGYAFFDKRLDDDLRLRSLVEEDLRHAIDRNELVLHYQPLVSITGEKILGVEALIRWKHPKRGMISPAMFIPIAEERGLIIQLGDWALRQACRDAMHWKDLTVAVNVSAIQFRDPNFVERTLQIVKDVGFDPWRLELELTEGVVVDNEDAAENAIIELRAAGIRLALDDFGTGYSSLIYLRRFAFDKIKIDKSFLDSMESTGESAILVHSVIHLGRALGLTVTAEGVETKEQHRFLHAAGCHQLQGYLFSKPVPASDIDRLLQEGLTKPSEAAA